jgi:hypothetical protein
MQESKKSSDPYLRLAILLLCGGALVFVAPCAKDEYFVWKAQNRFEDQTSEVSLHGKTADQVTEMLGGPPRSVHNFSDGDADMIYFGPYGEYCRVEVRGGAVTKVVHWTK